VSTPNDSLIIVIGRGHSGTRILSHTLYTSGVYMGKWLNSAGDNVPGKAMYRACAILAQHVGWDGGLSWDFDRLHTMPVDAEFSERVNEYVEDILAQEKQHKGWKLPETTLAYPWITRMFPRARYIYIVRDPRDCLLGKHLTDDLGKFNFPIPEMDDPLDQRVASWKYQYDIVKATPRPANFISVRYEDLVLDQEATLGRLEGFLGIPLARVIVDQTRIGQWKSDPDILSHLSPLKDAMEECGYDRTEVQAREK
jgi:hypothetical protein